MKLTQTLAQQQIFTPQMQQALALLQAPALELRTLVQKELVQNPVLEEEGGDGGSDDGHEAPEPTDAALDAHIEQARLLDEDSRAYFAQERATSQFTREDEERRQFFFDSLVEAETLAEHLMQQVRLSVTDEGIVSAAVQIAGNLDPDGFLRVPLEEVASSSSIDEGRLQEALAVIHTCHPVGVGARDLRECLLIQLDRLGKSEELEAVIVGSHIEDLAHHRYDLIARALKVEPGAVRAAAQFISTLDPKPGRAFLPEERQAVVVPEVFIEKVDGRWVVTSNDSVVPRLRISGTYKDLLANNGDQAELRSYLKERIRSGKSLIQCIHQRQHTLQRIAEEVVRRQVGFFDHGAAQLRPLTLAQVAAEVGVHETTVSRAIANKYAHTPHGIFELKYFFTPGYQSATGESISNTSIKGTLSEIVAKEDPRKPYSDEEIVQIFSERGVRLARRTIAKYRSELHILPSSMRREH